MLCASADFKNNEQAIMGKLEALVKASKSGG